MTQSGNANIGEFKDQSDRDKQFWKEWERTRVVRRCPKCGVKYSYSYTESDPGECPECR